MTNIITDLTQKKSDNNLKNPVSNLVCSRII